MDAQRPERFARHVLSPRVRSLWTACLLVATGLEGSGCGSTVIDEPMDPPADARTKKDATPGGEAGPPDSGGGMVGDPDSGGADDADRVVDDAAAPPPPAPDPDGGGAGDPCTTCVETQCGAELTACEADATCKKLLDCLDACADDACAAKCQKDYPSAKADDLFKCVESKCSKECY